MHGEESIYLQLQVFNSSFFLSLTVHLQNSPQLETHVGYIIADGFLSLFSLERLSELTNLISDK